MSTHPETPPDDTSDEISLLVNRLRETEQRLQELTGGGVDGVLYPGGQSYLLREAQEKLRLSEERFREMFNAAAIGMALSTPHGRFLQVNAAYCRMLGYTEGELLARDFASLTHPDDLSLNLEMRDELLSGRRDSFVLEKRYLKKNGDVQWTRASVSATRTAGGEIATLLMIAEDIGERKLAELRLRRLNRLHTVLSKVGEAIVRTRDRQSLYESICRIIVEDGLLRMVFIAEVDAEACVVRPVASCGAGQDTPLWQSTRAIPTDKGPASLGIVGVAVRSGAFDVCNDIAAAERMKPWREATSQSGLLAGASFPLMQNGAIVGVLTLFAGERDYFQDDEIELMAAVANNLCFALESLEESLHLKRTEEALQRQQIELLTLFNLMPALIWFKDTENRILRINQRAALATGKSVAEIEGRSMFEIYPLDAAKYHADDLEVIRSGAPKLAIIETLRDSEGKEIWVQTDKVPYRDKDGNVIGIVVMSQDISNRRRMEARFRRLVESNAQSVFFWNTKGEITGSNDAFLRLVGYTREDLEAGTMNWAAMTPPEYTDRDRRSVREAVDLGSCEAYEKEYIRKDGSRVPIVVGAATFEDDRTEGVCFVIDLTERKRVEETLRENLSLLESAQELAKLGSWTADITPEWRLEGSPEVYRMHAMPDGAFNHRGDAYLALVDPQDRQKVASAIGRTVKTGAPYDMEYRIIRPDGTVRWVHSLGRLEVRDAPRGTRMVGVMQDTTDARTAQQHLIQSQKMESIGQLSGGIAHDFNNLLGIIRLNVELIQDRMGQDTEADEMARIALEATERGASLTHQLLAYARQQPLEPRTVNIETLLAGMTSLLGRTLGESIDIKMIVPADLWTPNIDPHQLENALLNLAVNALHAMPTGGKLVIEAANKVLDEFYVELNPDVAPGSYVMIAVTDTGTGMSAETLERALEPFFTTKPVGKGSGLGLSMVQGFAKQSGGHLKIYSEVGRGTTVNLYLPKASVADEQQAEPRRREAPLSTGGERVLVVEDDEALRRLTLRVLAGLGYRTIEAEDGPSACLIADQVDSIDLLLTDVVLPNGMYGPELAQRVRERWPAVKVLYMSGYTRDAAFHDRVSDSHMHLISKPFSKAEIALMVRQVLDEGNVT